MCTTLVIAQNWISKNLHFTFHRARTYLELPQTDYSKNGFQRSYILLFIVLVHIWNYLKQTTV
jgi:hypothetical protein